MKLCVLVLCPNPGFLGPVCEEHGGNQHQGQCLNQDASSHWGGKKFKSSPKNKALLPSFQETAGVSTRAHMLKRKWKSWFLFACIVTQVCLTLSDPMDCSPPGSSLHGIFQARILEWVAIFLLQGIFLTQGSNLLLRCLLHCRWILYLLNPWGRPWLLFIWMDLT